MKKEILGIECKFAVYIPPNTETKRPDTHLIKELVHYKDGTFERRIKTIVNYQRYFWITKEMYRNHKDKKESESLDKVNMFRSTQSELAKNIAAQLGYKYVGKTNMRDIRKSPYVYGIDVSTGSEIKYLYKKKFPNIETTSNAVCMFDLETDVDTEEILIGSIAMENKIHTVILERILHNKVDVERRLDKLLMENLPDEKLKENLVTTYKVVKDEVTLMKELMKEVHKWQPEIVAIWNIGFDIPLMMRRCEYHNITCEEVFCDPSIDKKYHYFYYHKDTETRVTEKGVNKAKDVQDIWNYAYGCMGFWFIDAMSCYNYTRQGESKVPSGYSLDSILNHELGSNYKKIKFEHLNTSKLIGAHYHKFMVTNHPMEYIVYNQWDVYSMVVLNQRTNDLDINMEVLGGLGTYDIFSKNPRKIIANLHFFYLEHGYVLGAVDNSKEVEKLLGMDDWIVMLPSYRIKDRGGRILKESKKLPTNIRWFIMDLDQVSGYPSNGLAANVSKDTARREVISMGNIDKEDFKHWNKQLLFGPVNNVGFMTNICNFPTMFEIREKMNNMKGKQC